MLADVDAAMVVEVGVLGGDERLPDDQRDLVERHEVALLEEELADQLTTRGVDLGGDCGPVSGQLIDGRQILAYFTQHQEADHCGDRRGEHEREDQDSRQSAPDRTPRAWSPVASWHLSGEQYARPGGGSTLRRERGARIGSDPDAASR